MILARRNSGSVFNRCRIEAFPFYCFRICVVLCRSARPEEENSYRRFHPASLFGGVGWSGYGREVGFEVMHECGQMKSVCLNVNAQVMPWYAR
jgi:hypothetical protein